MTAHKHPVAPVPASACSPVAGAGTNPIGAVETHVSPASPTGEAGAPNLSNLSKPWGNDTICPGCNRGVRYSCICDPFFEDEEQMPAEDVVRIMGLLYPGWSRVAL